MQRTIGSPFFETGNASHFSYDAHNFDGVPLLCHFKMAILCFLAYCLFCFFMTYIEQLEHKKNSQIIHLTLTLALRVVNFVQKLFLNLGTENSSMVILSFVSVSTQPR